MGTRRFIAILIATILASATSVRATTELTGPHDNHTTGDEDGYDAFSGAYDVPADNGGVPSATFNDNGYDGLAVGGSGTSVTIEGGQFERDFNFGIAMGDGATVTISGGVFDGVANYGPSGVLTVNGGEFLGLALYVDGGAVAVYGGQYDTGADEVTLDILSGTVDLYGAFAGVSDGQTVMLPYTVTSLGSFYGELEDSPTPQTFSYEFSGGTLALHGTGTLPEPAALGLIGLAGIAQLPRRR